MHSMIFSAASPISTIIQMCDHQCPSDILCTKEEIHVLLEESLDISKVNGLDEISTHMLRSTATEIAPSLTKLLNCSITCGRPPACWQVSSVVPIPKTPNSTADYRPISHFFYPEQGSGAPLLFLNSYMIIS